MTPVRARVYRGLNIVVGHRGPISMVDESGSVRGKLLEIREIVSDAIHKIVF